MRYRAAAERRIATAIARYFAPHEEDSVSDEDLAEFIRRNEAQVRRLIEQRRWRGPRWFDRFKPSAGVPRDSTPAWARARETADGTLRPGAGPAAVARTG